MTLFDEKHRTLEGAASHCSDPYTYYNDSNRKEISNFRNLIESWFFHYPDKDKGDLKAQFKTDFYPSLFELYIYTLFRALGFELEIHPKIPNTEKHPDFLARQGENFFYIEVKYMKMKSSSEEGIERIKRTIYDTLDKTDASNFLLKLYEIQIKGTGQPSVKKIAAFFDQILKSTDPDLYTVLLNSIGELPPIVYEDEKVKIIAHLIPKSQDKRGTQTRTIGIFQGELKIGDDQQDIKEYLKSKATRYGELNAPYIICLNKQGVGLDIIEIQQALYGILAITYSENPENRDHKNEFSGDGFFGSKSNPHFTRVSGVYITNACDANLSTTCDHVFRHNPFAKYPVNFNLEQSAKDILNIPAGYPYNEGEQPDLLNSLFV